MRWRRSRMFTGRIIIAAGAADKPSGVTGALLLVG
jgi:hypothetical protein